MPRSTHSSLHWEPSRLLRYVIQKSVAFRHGYFATGSNNTAIGSNADVTANNLSNATAIGANAQVGCSNCLALGGVGANAVNAGIGTATPVNTLDVEGGLAVGAHPTVLALVPGAAAWWSPGSPIRATSRSSAWS